MRYSYLTIHAANMRICVRAEASKNALRKTKLCVPASDIKNSRAVFVEKYPPFARISTRGYALKIDNPCWSLHERKDSKLFTIKPCSRHKKIVAVLSGTMDRGDIYLADPTDDWIASRLGLFVFERMLARNGVFSFHSGAVRDGSNGYLFVGRSGVGKSTTARLWDEKRAQVIHDDRVMVCKKGRRFFMSSAVIFKRTRPNIFSGVRDVPLKMIFFLKHGRKNRLIPKNHKEIIEAMAAESVSLAWDRGFMRDLFYFLRDIADNVKGFEYEFVPNGTCVDFLRRRL